MANLRDYFEMFEDISKIEKVMISLSKYNRSRGGGILWIIFYWSLYIFSFYGIASHFEKNISNISIGFLIFIVAGFLFFLIIACFLIYGVSHQMSIMRRWHIQQFNDYRVICKETRKVLLDKNILQENIGQELNQLFLDFEDRYFPKK